MKQKCLFIGLAIALIPFATFANEYRTDNGYDVELYWKVKHRQKLIVWGSVENGKKCKQLNVHIGMKHNKGWYRNFEKNISRPHIPTSGSPFKFEKKQNSKSLPDKGWYPDYISVDCTNFYRKS